MGAEADFKALVEFSPNADRFFHLAKIYNASDRIVEAKEVSEKAIEFGLGEDSLHPLD
jgi:hypothetical protein